MTRQLNVDEKKRSNIVASPCGQENNVICFKNGSALTRTAFHPHSKAKRKPKYIPMEFCLGFFCTKELPSIKICFVSDCPDETLCIRCSIQNCEPTMLRLSDLLPFFRKKKTIAALHHARTYSNLSIWDVNHLHASTGRVHWRILIQNGADAF